MASSESLHSAETRLDSRKKDRRNATVALIFFLLLIVMLGLLRSSDIVVVVSLYTSIAFAAISAVALIFLSGSSYQGTTRWDAMFEREPSETSSPILSETRDVVNSLYVYVKYASRGSVYSRKEIAFALRSIMEEFSLPKSMTEVTTEIPDLADDGNEGISETFERDLSVVYYPYIKGYDEDSAKRKGWLSRGDGEVYLRSLEDVIKKIKTNELLGSQEAIAH